jgi:hypothetical protein
MAQPGAPVSLCFAFENGRCVIAPDAEREFLAFAEADDANRKSAISFLDGIRKEALRLSEQIEADTVFE